MKVSRIFWAALAAASGSVASFAARKAVDKAWRVATHDEPPENQDDPSARSLLLWAGLSAVVVAVASTGARLYVKSLITSHDSDALSDDA